MTRIFLLFIIATAFVSCDTLFNKNQYYPDSYEAFYKRKFPYLHNYKDSIEIKLFASKDTFLLFEPINVHMKVYNLSNINPMYFYFPYYIGSIGSFSQDNSEIIVSDSNNNIIKNHRPGHMDISRNIVKHEDKLGRTLTIITDQGKKLLPKESECIYYLYNVKDHGTPKLHKIFQLFYSFDSYVLPAGDYYIQYYQSHMEFDSLFNPHETIIKSNKLKISVVEPHGTDKIVYDDFNIICDTLSKANIKDAVIMINKFIEKYPRSYYTENFRNLLDVNVDSSDRLLKTFLKQGKDK